MGICGLLRRSELHSLKWNNVTDRGNEISVEFYRAKAIGVKESDTFLITCPKMLEKLRLYASYFSEEVKFLFYFKNIIKITYRQREIHNIFVKLQMEIQKIFKILESTLFLNIHATLLQLLEFLIQNCIQDIVIEDPQQLFWQIQVFQLCNFDLLEIGIQIKLFRDMLINLDQAN